MTVPKELTVWGGIFLFFIGLPALLIMAVLIMTMSGSMLSVDAGTLFLWFMEWVLCVLGVLIVVAVTCSHQVDNLVATFTPYLFEQIHGAAAREQADEYSRKLHVDKRQHDV